MRFFRSIFVFMLFFGSSYIYTAVLELEESQVQGKKDQPEAMTFVSRSSLDKFGAEYEFDAYEAIYKDTKIKIFGSEE